MDAFDNTLINELETLLQAANPDLLKKVWSGTTGDVRSTVKFLKELLQDNNKTQTMPVYGQYIGHTIPIQSDIGTLTEFGNIDEIQDPDLKFALELQREEVEREQNLKKQQDEDSLFALRLQQGGDFNLNNVVSTNPQLNLATKVSDVTSRKLQKEDTEPLKITIDDDDKTCVVCLDIDRNAVFAPCAHRICCVKCAHNVFQAKRFCPLCWTDLEGVIECQNMAHK